MEITEQLTGGSMFKVAWLNARPYCWAASIDGGKTWEKLKADDDEDSSEAVDEAAEKFGAAPNKWDVLDEPISSLADGGHSHGG